MWKEFTFTFLQYGLVYASTGLLGIGVLFWLAFLANRSAAARAALPRVDSGAKCAWRWRSLIGPHRGACRSAPRPSLGCGGYQDERPRVKLRQRRNKRHPSGPPWPLRSAMQVPHARRSPAAIEPYSWAQIEVRYFMSTIRMSPIALFLLAAVSSLAAPAYAGFVDMLGRVPAEVNVLMLIDAEQIAASPLATREGWRGKREADYQARPLTFPPQAAKLVRAGNSIWTLTRANGKSRFSRRPIFPPWTKSRKKRRAISTRSPIAARYGRRGGGMVSE